MEVCPAPASDGTETKGLKPLISLYSNCLWNRVRCSSPLLIPIFSGKFQFLPGLGNPDHANDENVFPFRCLLIHWNHLGMPLITLHYSLFWLLLCIFCTLCWTPCNPPNTLVS
ncbi:hypothetical protein ACFX15_028406 [Malus domestica]